MPTVLKPPKRERKPRKPIRRSKRPTRTSGTKSLSRGGGVKRTSRGRVRRSDLRLKADALFAIHIRNPQRCTNSSECRSSRADATPAGKAIQCAHIVSRRYRNTRWEEANAIPLCAADHKFFTEHPLEWDDWVEALIGVEAYEELKRKAKGAPCAPTYGEVIARYPEEEKLWEEKLKQKRERRNAAARARRRA